MNFLIVEAMSALLLCCILTTSSAHLNIPYLNTLTVLGENYDHEIPHEVSSALRLSVILATFPAHLNLLYLSTLTILGENYNHELRHCEVLSTPILAPLLFPST